MHAAIILLCHSTPSISSSHFLTDLNYKLATTHVSPLLLLYLKYEKIIECLTYGA